MAPELWRGEPANRAPICARSASCSELLAGAAPHSGIATALLRGVIGRNDIPRIGRSSPGSIRGWR
jgi:hypothetical protein